MNKESTVLDSVLGEMVARDTQKRIDQAVLVAEFFSLVEDRLTELRVESAREFNKKMAMGGAVSDIGYQRVGARKAIRRYAADLAEQIHSRADSQR